MRILLRVVMVALLGVAASAAVAQQSTPIPLPPQEATHLRLAHFSPDVLALDVWIDIATSDLTAVSYPSVTDWIALPAGNHEIALVPAGNPYSEAIIGPMTLELLAMEWNTIAVVGSLSGDTLTAVILGDPTGDMLAGTARLTFFNGVDQVPSISFYRDNIAFTTGMAFGESFSVDDDADTHHYQVMTGGDNPTLLAELPEVETRETYSYLIAAIGAAGGTGAAAPQIVVHQTPRAEYLLGLGLLEAPGTIVQAVQGEDLTGELASALRAADLTGLLQGEGPFTLFAPAEFTMSRLETDDPDALANILSNHIVEGEYLAQDLVEGQTLTSVSGNPLQVGVSGNNITVNGTRILTVNIPATNGVIHLIGDLLLPPPAE